MGFWKISRILIARVMEDVIVIPILQLRLSAITALLILFQKPA